LSKQEYSELEKRMISLIFLIWFGDKEKWKKEQEEGVPNWMERKKIFWEK
jgi:hypothetical protein